MTDLGRLLVLFSVVFFVIGLLLIISPKIPLLGKLPGDILIKRDGLTFYFPIATSIIISALLSILINLFLRR